MIDDFFTWLTAANDTMYLYVLVGLLVAAGVVLTVWTRFVQVRHFGTMVRHIGVSRRDAQGGISSFQAFAIGMATRIGIGNITGVALALVLGGPGAIFWMWMVSLVGMATSFAEASLAQLYKVPAGDGTFRGGPAWYIWQGLRSRALGAAFAVLLIFSMVVAMPMVQANSISVLVVATAPAVPTWVAGLVMATLTGVVVLGGVRSVARTAEWLTPLMALIYIGLAAVVVVMNISAFPAFLGDIVAGAFGLREGLAGVAGGVVAALLNGARRGLFSNEAGMGTNPNAAATATVAHPAQQGFIQSFGVFFDTWFVCTSTAFIILSAGPTVFTPGVTGMGPDGPNTDVAGTLTTEALAAQLGGWVPWLMVVVIFFFGFSSILGAYAYAESNVVFLGGQTWLTVLCKISAVVCTFIGAVLALHKVWTLMDTAMVFITVVNLVALLALGRHVVALVRDYERQRAAGIERPRFTVEEAVAASGLPAGTATTVWHASEPARAGSDEAQRPR